MTPNFLKIFAFIAIASSLPANFLAHRAGYESGWQDAVKQTTVARLSRFGKAGGYQLVKDADG